MLDKTQVAGYLAVRVRRIDELRRADPTFPAPRLLSPGILRWPRAELDRWIAGLRTGWSSMGGHRTGAFRRTRKSRGVAEAGGIAAVMETERR